MQEGWGGLVKSWWLVNYSVTGWTQFVGAMKCGGHVPHVLYCCACSPHRVEVKEVAWWLSSVPSIQSVYRTRQTCLGVSSGLASSRFTEVDYFWGEVRTCLSSSLGPAFRQFSPSVWPRDLTELFSPTHLSHQICPFPCNCPQTWYYWECRSQRSKPALLSFLRLLNLKGHCQG